MLWGRSRAGVARDAHYVEATGSSPVCATKIMSAYADTLTNQITGPYRWLDARWKALLEATGPKWKEIWRSGMYYVRRSNAWPKPLEEDRVDS